MNEVDVVLVASNPADYSAVQSVRASRPESLLAPANEEKAAEIAGMAEIGTPGPLHGVQGQGCRRASRHGTTW